MCSVEQRTNLLPLICTTIYSFAVIHSPSYSDELSSVSLHTDHEVITNGMIIIYIYDNAPIIVWHNY